MLKPQSLLTSLACIKMPSGLTSGLLISNMPTAGGSTITCPAELLKNQNSTPTCVHISLLACGITGSAPGIADSLTICGQLLNVLSNGCCRCVAMTEPSCGPKKNTPARGTTHCSQGLPAFGTHSHAPSIWPNSSMNQNHIGLRQQINYGPSLPRDPMPSNQKRVGRWTGTTQYSPTQWKATKPRLVLPICGTHLLWKAEVFVA